MSGRGDWKTCLSLASLATLVLSGCTTYTTRPGDGRGRPTVMEDPTTVGRVAGVGIESQDVITMAHAMAGDILAAPAISGRQPPARVVVDAAYLRNQSSSVIDKTMLTDRLRVELTRSCQGKMVFLARHYGDMMEKERELEKEGAVTKGTGDTSERVLGYDFRLGGRITSIDSVDARSGVRSSFHQITFELVERGSGAIAWSKAYGFRKAAQDSVIYR
jgi:penicillin-binding protein activator